MDGKFSKYLKRKKPILKKLLSLLLNKYEYASILATDVKGVNISVDKFSTSISPSGITECGFVIRVLSNNVYSEYSLSEIEEKNFDKIISDLDDITSKEHKTEVVSMQGLEEEELVKKFNRRSLGKQYTNDEIIDILKKYLNQTLEGSDLVVNAALAVECVETSKMFLSGKKDLEQYYTWNNPRCHVVVRRGDNTKIFYDGFGSNNLEECLTKLEKSIHDTKDIAIELLDSENPKPGYYDVITDPSITGLIAHEAFGHGVEMDMFVKDRAKAKEYMSKRVASPLVNMRDGAKATFSVASYFFDDDGVLAQNTKIIKNGILINGISDCLSALELSTTPTGNGRRESYKRKSYTRMTNTFFESGKDDLEDMIKSIDYGYLISTTNNGMEDPKNWGIQCVAHYGREIVNGKFTGKIISPVVMSGSVVDLLNSISMVSKDFKVDGSGSCGKGYKEWVRVSDGGPYLKGRVRIG